VGCYIWWQDCHLCLIEKCPCQTWPVKKPDPWHLPCNGVYIEPTSVLAFEPHATHPVGDVGESCLMILNLGGYSSAVNKKCSESVEAEGECLKYAYWLRSFGKWGRQPFDRWNSQGRDSALVCACLVVFSFEQRFRKSLKSRMVYVSCVNGVFMGILFQVSDSLSPHLWLSSMMEELPLVRSSPVLLAVPRQKSFWGWDTKAH